MLIISEQQAHEVGKSIGGEYTVGWYEHRPTRITAFVVILPGGRRITLDPRAAAPRNQNGE